MGKGRLNLDVVVRAAGRDTTPPAVTMISPSGGVLFGSVVVSASASDNVGVAGVRFLLDDNPLGAEDTAAPYELTWPTATVSNGTHVLTAVARDAAGNQSSSIVSVTVSNDTAAPNGDADEPGRRRDAQWNRDGGARRRRTISRSSACSSSWTACRWARRTPSRRTK